MRGTIFRIERFAIHDGPGIRTTVFLKGCPLRCAWCHSPESQSSWPEFMPLPDRCIGCGRCLAACPQHAFATPGAPPRADLCRSCGSCAAACPTGARALAGDQVSAGAVIDLIERDRIFYDESGGGVTVSGGEPLMQAAFVETLVETCRARGIHTAVDTSGFGDPTALDRIRPDLFLFDVKAIDDQRHRAITGVSNRVILENLARLAARTRAGGAGAAGEAVTPSSPTCPSPPTRPSSPTRPNIIVRFPLVPGFTDTDDNLRDVAGLVSSLGLARVDVLPYHRAGLAKYARLGVPYALSLTDPPTKDQVQRAVEILSECGLDVRVGGT
jgi:pyruvate formate lyase activating enzyme